MDHEKRKGSEQPGFSNVKMNVSKSSFHSNLSGLNEEKSIIELNFLLVTLRHLFAILDRIETTDLSSEVNAIIDAITYETFSPKTGKVFLNVSRCKRAILSKILANEDIRDLYKSGQFNRSTVYRATRQLLKTGLVVTDNDKKLILNPKILPSLRFLQIIKGIDK